MLTLDSLIAQISSQCCYETKSHIDLIVKQNSRVENYFSVLILILLERLRIEEKIVDYNFQYLFFDSNDHRKHIDFYIKSKEFTALFEIKHLVIDSKKKKNRRNIKFYLSTSSQGKKVGVLGDLLKLDTCIDNRTTDLVSFSIVSNPPEQDYLHQQIIFFQNKANLTDWNIRSYTLNSASLSFIVCNKKI